MGPPLLQLVTSLREAAHATDDAAAIQQVGLAHLLDAGLAGVALLGADRPGGRDVLAAAGSLDDLRPGTLVELPTGLGRIVLEVPGEVVAAVLVDVAPEVMVPRHRELAVLVAAVVDREMVHQRVRTRGRERAKELTALRAVQLAIQEATDRSELCGRITDALAVALQHPDVTRIELELDGIATTAGVDGRFQADLGREVLVEGIVRGRLRAGYVVDRPFLEPEEPRLISSTIESLELHLAREDAGAALAASEARLRGLLQNLPAVVWVATPDLTLTVLSVAEGLPIGSAGLEGRSLDDGDGPVAGQLAELHRRAFRGEHVHDELAWQDRWWDMRLEPLDTDGSAARQVLGLALDVTEQRRAGELEARLAALVEDATLAIVSVDLDGTITSWNAGATELFGWERDEAVGKPVSLLRPADPDEADIVSFEDRFLTGGAYTPYLETKRRHRDGHDLEVGVWLSPITGPDGSGLGAASIYTDLTERNRVRRALEASEQQFRQLADSAQDLVYRMRLEPERVVEYVNPVSAVLLGFPPEAFLDDPDLLVGRTHPDDRDLPPVAADGPAGLRPATLRYRWQHADGHWIWLEDHRTPVVESGRVVELSGIVRDVTDQVRTADALRTALERERQAADELRRLDDLKTGFLSAVSHELRTPLTVVIGFAETARRLGPDREDERQRFLERLVVNAHRLEGLVSDLLDVDRLARGKVEPRRERVDLAALTGRVVRRSDPGDHQLESDLQVFELEVDPAMLERAVDNLVRNAIRHTPDGTTVWVRLRRRVDGAELVVEDDGPGIPAELRDRIFEPFLQGPPASGSASPGTGIGLSLVQRFVDLHGGTVVADERPGGGARFTVRLPSRP